MKAHLLLEVDYLFEKEYEPEDERIIVLSLVINDKVKYSFYQSEYIDDNDIEDYFSKIEDLINQSTLIINAIPGIKLIVDQSICEFIEGKEEETKKFVQMMITAI